MKTSRRQIASILAKRSADPSVDTKKLSRQIAAYLLQTGRTGELSSLSRDVMQQRTQQGIIEVTAVSAHTLSPALRKDIEDKMRELYPQSKKIIINELIDAEMIGGVRLEMANEQIDLTLRGKLNRFKQLTIAGKD